MDKRVRYIVILFVLSYWPLAYGEMRDPTYPAGFVNNLGNIAAESLTLSAILVSKDRQVAVINDQPLAVGETILGYKILEIEPNLVVLDGPQGRITMYLLNQPPVRQDSLKQG